MKKTLLAVALATSAFSGQALAWTNGSTSGTFELGGTFTTTLPPQVWEAKLGTSPALNANIKPTDLSVKIPVAADIPVLGMRVADKSGIYTPVAGGTNNVQINYGGKSVFDLTSINNGVGSLTLDVHDDKNAKIGSFEAKMTVVGVASAARKDVTGTGIYSSLFSPDNNTNRGFSGGLAVTAAGAIKGATDAAALVTKLFSDNNFQHQSLTPATNAGQLTFNGDASVYDKMSGAYASGILSGTEITINLDKTISADTNWKVNFPITISYA